MAHEFGHNFGLDHTYEHDPLEVNHTGGTEFLWDVFGREQQPWCQHTPPERVCLHDAGWDCDPFDSTNTCTNNIMGGTAYSRHFSALQCGRIQRALQVSSLRHFAYGEENPPDLHITRNQLVDYSRRYYQNVIVDSGVTLTISCQVEMSPNARIIVRPGGKLIVDGGTLTSACAGEMWQGIEVVGDRTKNQTAANQGVVELRNGATIENALCGIYTGLRGDTDFATTGGIVSASDATFKNNRQSVVINSYAYTALSGSISNYNAMFARCTFAVDNDNLFAANNVSFAEHVRLWDVKGVTFEGCTFSNSTNNPYWNGKGIYAEDAGVLVNTYCPPQPTFVCECPETDATYSSFSGFTTAVEVNTSGNPYAVRLDGCRFSNSGTGVRINGNQFTTVTRSQFNMDQHPDHAFGNTGLVLSGCSGYKVEENLFERTSYPNGLFVIENSTGIAVSNSGVSANSLYRNVFNNLTRGISVAGNNGVKRMNGLQMTCNYFSGNKYDIYLAPSATVCYHQGTSTKGADNEFHNTSVNVSNFYNPDVRIISYIYNNGNASLCPAHFTGLDLAPVNASNNCASTLCGAVPDPGPVTSFAAQVNAYATAVAGMDGVETQGQTVGGCVKSGAPSFFCKKALTLAG